MQIIKSPWLQKQTYNLHLLRSADSKSDLIENKFIYEKKMCLRI